LLKLVRVRLEFQRTGLQLVGYRYRRSIVFVGGNTQQLHCWLLGAFLLEPIHHVVDLGL
jgi:hypothetical protein